MSDGALQTSRNGARMALRVTPRAAKPGIGVFKDGRLQVRVAAPPVDGAANEAVVEVLALALGIAKARVTVVGGAHSRHKLVEISGLTVAEVLRALSGSRT